MPRGSKNPPNKGKGRKKGVPNKISRAFKEAVLNVFNQLGGEGHLLTWARKNPTEYYKIAARLIPQEQTIKPSEGVDGEIGGYFVFTSSHAKIDDKAEKDD